MNELENNRLYVIDPTSGADHDSVRVQAIGASEYQLYCLLSYLSCTTQITCYNNRQDERTLNGIEYKPIATIMTDNLDPGVPILCMRFLPAIYGNVFEKIRRHRLILWCHDILNHYRCFLWAETIEDFPDETAFRDRFLKKLATIHLDWVFVSESLRDQFMAITQGYGIRFGNTHVHYNILYENQFLAVRQQAPEIDWNRLVYASAWQKGIDHVLDWFSYAVGRDADLTLHLMSPGYDWGQWEEYRKEIRSRFGDRVVIHGPMKKKDYANIVSASLCVLSPPFWETFGCVFAESYYLGTPVIADTGSGAVREIIDARYICSLKEKEAYFQMVQELRRNRHRVRLDARFMLPNVMPAWEKIIRPHQ